LSQGGFKKKIQLIEILGRIVESRVSGCMMTISSIKKFPAQDTTQIAEHLNEIIYE
jgi:hypothetical protein